MKQITILAHRPNGAIAEITQLMAEAGINIESIAGRQIGLQAIITVSVDATEKAVNALHSVAGLQVMAEDALLLRVGDEVGALAKITRRLTESKIDIRSIRFIERRDGYALIALSTEMPDKARDALADLLLNS